MTIQLPNSFVAQFEKEVHLKFQADSKLKGTLRTVQNVVGSTVRFTSYDQTAMEERIVQSPVVSANIDITTATATIKNYIKSAYTEYFDMQKINYDERSVLVETLGHSMGRQHDQSVIDALDASTTTNTVAVATGTDNGFNLGKIRAAKEIMDANGVPPDNRHMAIDAASLGQFLGRDRATSMDYNSVRTLVEGAIDSYIGFKYHMIANLEEGGLPLSGNNVTIFAWHHNAAGLGIGQNQNITISREETWNSWLTKATMALGAVAIDNRGIVKITSDTSVAVA